MNAHAPYIASSSPSTSLRTYKVRHRHSHYPPITLSQLDSGTDHEERRVTLSLSHVLLSPSYYTYTFNTIPIYIHLDLLDLVSIDLLYSIDLFDRGTSTPFTLRAPFFLRACRYLDQP